MNDHTGERWRPVVGWEGLYEVSDHGQVRGLPRTVSCGFGGLRSYGLRLVRQRRTVRGYFVVSFQQNCQQTRYWVHRLVLEAFVGPRPEGMITRHLDGNPENNHVSNLRWGTVKENAADMMRHGRSNPPIGERCGTAKLTWEKVREMRHRRKLGEPIADLASSFGVSQATVSTICNNLHWIEKAA